jgi:transcriptional regulator ATRX
MVSFVKPNYLGTKKEFRNRFANPIENGQHRDSTVTEVQLMKQRTHILHKTLESCVQRKDFETIKAFLPVKQEYAIFVRLTAKQCDLYETYLNTFSFGKQSTINQRMNGVQLFTDFHNFSRICTHPWLLKIHADLDMTKESKQLYKRKQDENDDDDDDRSLLESDDDGLVELKFDTLWWNEMVTSHDEYVYYFANMPPNNHPFPL